VVRDHGNGGCRENDEEDDDGVPHGSGPSQA
jgi:hypothetical protein